MPKQEDDQGPCSRVGSSPIVGRWWWHAGTERPKGVQEAEADISPRGVSPFRFSLLPLPYIPYHPLPGY